MADKNWFGFKQTGSDTKVEKGTLGVIVSIDDSANTAEIKWCHGDAGLVRTVEPKQGRKVYSLRNAIEETAEWKIPEFPGLYAKYDPEARYHEVCASASKQAKNGNHASRK